VPDSQRMQAQEIPVVPCPLNTKKSSHMSHLASASRRLIQSTSFIRISVISALAISLVGCASSGSGGGVLDKALEAVGLSKPAPPELPADGVRLPPQAKKITLRLHAGDILNTDANGRPLALVAHVYKLRSATAFLQAPYDAFKDSTSEKQVLGNDIVEVRELVMTPGKKYEVVETVPNEATHIAVVALFRAPDAQRWKFVFDSKEAVRTGVTLGMHACALSVAEGQPLGVPLEVRRLAGMQCPAP
jgi:type VI secretion system protein VasD